MVDGWQHFGDGRPLLIRRAALPHEPRDLPDRKRRGQGAGGTAVAPRRDQLIVVIGFETDLWTSEVCDLRVGDRLRFGGGGLVVPNVSRVSDAARRKTAVDWAVFRACWVCSLSRSGRRDSVLREAKRKQRRYKSVISTVRFFLQRFSTRGAVFWAFLKKNGRAPKRLARPFYL